MEPMATTFISVFENRLPNRPFRRKPTSGKKGMSQRCMTGSLELHGIDFINLESATVFEDGENDCEADGGFRGSNHHYKERVDVTVDSAQMVGKRYKAQIHRVEHQLNGHEDRNDAFSVQESSHTQREQHCTQQQIPGQRNRWDLRHRQSISFL